MYQALYRKWRPQTFADVVGQEHITASLLGALKSGRLSHAYLFTGSRGTGKTTCAKILAKAVNCLHPVDGNPCNECEICRGIDAGSVLDVIEIDAASNNGVDNIRDLREEANYTPTQAKYRVYIIDEVHMLSTGAFNALLKTLEEPPEHVKFILATTEVHKLPATILSRCQRFDFKRIEPEDIAARLQFVAQQENLTLLDDAALLIARLSDGALRDALSLLDRCSAYGEDITEAVVAGAAGLAGRERLFALTDAIAEGNSARALELIQELYQNACNMERLVLDLTSHFRNMMILKTVNDYGNLIVCPQNEIDKLKQQATHFSLARILNIMDVLSETAMRLKGGANRRSTVEVAVLRLANPKLDTDASALLSRISELERKLQNGSFTANVNGQSFTQTVNVTPQPVSSSPLQSEKRAVEMPQSPVKSSDSPVPKPPKTVPVAPKAMDEFPFDVDTPPLPPEPPVSASASVPTAPPMPAPPVREEPRQMPASPAHEPAPTASGDTPFAPWRDVLERLRSIDMPLYAHMTDSAAFVHGDYLLIQSQNPLLDNFLKMPTHVKCIARAVGEVTGQKFTLGKYNTPEDIQRQRAAQAAAPPKDPLENLLSHAEDLGVHIVEQQ